MLTTNEAWGVCQNIKKYMAGVDHSCTSEDVKKCESILTTLNDPLKAADDLLSSIETKRKTLYKEDHSYRTSQLQTERAASGATARTAAGIKQVNND